MTTQQFDYAIIVQGRKVPGVTLTLVGEPDYDHEQWHLDKEGNLDPRRTRRDDFIREHAIVTEHDRYTGEPRKVQTYNLI